MMTLPRDLHPAVDIIAFFKARSAVVAAAVRALEAMPEDLTAMRRALDGNPASTPFAPLRRLVALVHGAAVGSDNLLVARATVRSEPFVVCAVKRDADGVVDVRTIELDRSALALKEDGGSQGGVLDRLIRAIDGLSRSGDRAACAEASRALDATTAQVRSATSRLAIVNARLDLQERLLATAVEGAPPLPDVRLDSHLSGSRARDMALEARRLLSARPMTIANSERRAISLPGLETAGRRPSGLIAE